MKTINVLILVMDNNWILLLLLMNDSQWLKTVVMKKWLTLENEERRRQDQTINMCERQYR